MPGRYCLELQWSNAEIEHYLKIKPEEIEKIYEDSKISNNLVKRTEYILKKLALSVEDYAELLRHDGRPEILASLERKVLESLSLKQNVNQTH